MSQVSHQGVTAIIRRWIAVPEMLGNDGRASIGEKNAHSSTLFGESTRNPMPSKRRPRPRLKTRCGIHLLRVDDQVMVTTDTDNLSDEGFYCTSDQPFSPGDRLECEVFVPTGGPDFHGPTLALHGCARVLRVEIRGLEPGFGITCEFEEQHVTAE